MLRRNRLDARGVARGNQNPRRRLTEQQKFGPQIGIELDRGADSVPKEHSASATARPPSLRSCADSAKPSFTICADGRLDALLEVHIERRRQSPQIVAELLWRTGCRRTDLVAVAEAAEQHDCRGRRCWNAMGTGGAVFIRPTIPITGVGKIASPRVSL